MPHDIFVKFDSSTLSVCVARSSRSLRRTSHMDNTMSRRLEGLRGSQLIWIARCSTPYDTPTFYASRIQAVCRTAHWAVSGSLFEREGGSQSSSLSPSQARHTPKPRLSLFSWALSETRRLKVSGSRRPARWRGGTVVMVSAGSQHSAQYYLSLLTQARIPS